MSEAIHQPHRVLFLAKTACPCVNAAGSLTTRTDNDTGSITLSSGHGIATGLVDVSWDAGVRTGMDATVVGDACAIDGGAGANLPAAATPVVAHQVGDYPAAATSEYGIIFQAPSLNVDELVLAARQNWSPVKAYLRTARMLAEGTVVEVWFDRGIWLIAEGVTVGGKAQWIEFEIAAAFDSTDDYVIADLIDFHDGCDPDPIPNPDAHAGVLTTRTDDDTGVVTCAVHGVLTTRTDANTGTITAAGHGLATGDHADVFWSGGARDHMDVAVSGDAVTVDGGTGDDLPAATTAVLLTESFTGPVVPYWHGLVEGDYADVFWQIAAVNYTRKRMVVTAVSGNQVTLDEEAGVTSGSALPAADSDVTVLKSFVVWNTLHMYAGYFTGSVGVRGTAKFSPAKPAYTSAGAPRPSVAAQLEDRYYIDGMECEITTA